jgi:hypothetical protein
MNADQPHGATGEKKLDRRDVRAQGCERSSATVVQLVDRQSVRHQDDDVPPDVLDHSRTAVVGASAYDWGPTGESVG